MIITANVTAHSKQRQLKWDEIKNLLEIIIRTTRSQYNDQNQKS